LLTPTAPAIARSEWPLLAQRTHYLDALLGCQALTARVVDLRERSRALLRVDRQLDAMHGAVGVELGSDALAVMPVDNLSVLVDEHGNEHASEVRDALA
jgi:hypothetical protein